MKAIAKFCLILFVACFLLTGCTHTVEAPPPAQENTDPKVYLDRIAELEAALQQEKEDRFISDTAYAAIIKELQSKLNALAPKEDEQEDEKDESMVFRYQLQDGKAIITGYEGRSTLVVIPTELDGHPVAAIGERAFEGKKIAAVTLPEGLEAIGWFAFYNCTELMDVTVPSSVTSIGYAVFDGCPRVTVICEKGSYAQQYAASYGMAWLNSKP